ncbi:MAG: GIY-YIG nuclease family protein, partial [Planctomycetota bacterium]
MAVSELRLIKHCVEYIKRSKENIENIPRKIRGIYVLYKKRSKRMKPKGGNAYDVVYIGMVGGEKQAGVGGRLRSHNKQKEGWTHFSIFEVWDNIREEEVRELEGILRHVFRKDSHANKLGIQKS